jgi:hypothetical protein
VVGVGKVPSIKKAKSQNPAEQIRLVNFGIGLWLCVGVVALVAPWPYAFSAVLFATFLHFAALDGADRS